MSRVTIWLVLGIFMSMLLAPAVVLVEFHVHRASIVKELCVQRDVVESMRTCHGECQLSKRFRALENESKAGFPTERIHLRLEPQVPIVAKTVAVPALGTKRYFPEHEAGLMSGFLFPADHVPRA